MPDGDKRKRSLISVPSVANPECWFATYCASWGRAIWRGERPDYSAASRSWHRSGGPFASDRGGTKWLLDTIWPEDLELAEGEIREIEPLERLCEKKRTPTEELLLALWIRSAYADDAGLRTGGVPVLEKLHQWLIERRLIGSNGFPNVGQRNFR